HSSHTCLHALLHLWCSQVLTSKNHQQVRKVTLACSLVGVPTERRRPSGRPPDARPRPPGSRGPPYGTARPPLRSRPHPRPGRDSAGGNDTPRALVGGPAVLPPGPPIPSRPRNREGPTATPVCSAGRVPPTP